MNVFKETTNLYLERAMRTVTRTEIRLKGASTHCRAYAGCSRNGKSCPAGGPGRGRAAQHRAQGSHTKQHQEPGCCLLSSPTGQRHREWGPRSPGQAAGWLWKQEDKPRAICFLPLLPGSSHWATRKVGKASQVPRTRRGCLHHLLDSNCHLRTGCYFVWSESSRCQA